MRTNVKGNFVVLKSGRTNIKMKLTHEQMKWISEKSLRMTASGMRNNITRDVTPEQYYNESFHGSLKVPAKISFGKESVFSEVYVNVMAGDPVVIDVYREFDKDRSPLFMEKDPSLVYGVELIDRFILIGSTGTADRFHKQLCDAVAEMELEKA